ncbi:hypothetical protein ACIBSV_33695 [Embleya sp. NPDC050154]|uniref:hypothetical protein n=1 Tax=unclassified Embleya TaxID=2699296 RepID=UPI0037928CD3
MKDHEGSAVVVLPSGRRIGVHAIVDADEERLYDPGPEATPIGWSATLSPRSPASRTDLHEIYRAGHGRLCLPCGTRENFLVVGIRIGAGQGDRVDIQGTGAPPSE